MSEKFDFDIKPNKSRNRTIFALAIVLVGALIATAYLLNGSGDSPQVTGAAVGTNSVHSSSDSLFNIWSKKGDSSLVNAVLLLREASIDHDTMRIAELVTEIESSIKESEYAEQMNAWNALLECVYSQCEDADYLRLMNLIVSTDLKNTQNRLSHNIIQLYVLWDGKQVVEFSRYLSETNEMIAQIESPVLQDTWKAWIECNGECEKSDELVFALLTEVLK